MRFSSAPLRLATKPRALARAQPKRLASNSTEAAQKKAQEALTSAQKVAEKAWAATRSFLGPVGERFSGLLGGA